MEGRVEVMKKFSGKYCTVIFNPFRIDRQKFLRALIKRVNEIKRARGLDEIDSDDLDRGWQNMPVEDQIELTKKKLARQAERRKNEILRG